MTKAQLENLYRVACQGKGFKPNDGQFKIWTLTLLHLDEADLSQAMVWYFSENSDFPMPALLKPLAERARRERDVKIHEDEIYTSWCCSACGTTVGTFNPDHIPQRCNGVLAVPLKHPDYGKACTSTSFVVNFRDVYKKEGKNSVHA